MQPLLEDLASYRNLQVPVQNLSQIRPDSIRYELSQRLPFQEKFQFTLIKSVIILAD